MAIKHSGRHQGCGMLNVSDKCNIGRQDAVKSLNSLGINNQYKSLTRRKVGLQS